MSSIAIRNVTLEDESDLDQEAGNESKHNGDDVANKFTTQRSSIKF